MLTDNPLSGFAAGLDPELFDAYQVAYTRFSTTKRDAEAALRSLDQPTAREALANNASAEQAMFLTLGALLTDLEDSDRLPAWFQCQAIDAIKAEAARHNLSLSLGRGH